MYGAYALLDGGALGTIAIIFAEMMVALNRLT